MRAKINYEQMPARFPKGTLARINAVLVAGETRTDLIRAAVEAEIIRRSAGAGVVAVAASVEPVEAVKKRKRAVVREVVPGEPPAGSDDLMDMLSRAFKV